MADGVSSVLDGDSGEDVPNNFFDDFDKDDFMDGLKVIDSLHEKDDDESELQRQSVSPGRINRYSNPCSQRRDLEKTNAAILRDKEAKVKEHLAKHLESKDDIRPPGTELDDFFDKVRHSKIKQTPELERERERDRNERAPGPKKHEYQDSPMWHSPSRYSHYEDCDDFHSSGRGMRKFYQSGPKHMNNYNHGFKHYNSRYNLPYSPHQRSRHVPNKYTWHKNQQQTSPPHRYKHSPHSWRGSHHSPRNSPRYSPPHRSRHSPHRSSRYSPRRSSPRRPHHSPRHSPWRNSRYDSHKSPSRGSRKRSRSRSPHSPRSYSKHRASKDGRSPERNVCWSPVRSPRYDSRQNSHYNIQDTSQQFIQQPYEPEISNMNNTPYMYPPTGDYNTYLGPPGQPDIPIIPQGPPNMLLNQMGPPDMSMSQAGTQVMPMPVSMPQPVPLPIDPVPPVMLNQNIPPSNFMASQVPMVSHPSAAPSVTTISQPQLHAQSVKASCEALAQLVAEGKLSHEDFLKLAPINKGSNNAVDYKTKKVMSRCSFAVQRLSKLMKPHRLVLKNDECSTEPQSVSQKYCSPLKRQAPVEFDITSVTHKNIHNKLLLNNIVATIGLEKSFLGSVATKEVKNVGVQTTTPYCDVCEIRDSVETSDMATTTDSEFFSSTVHTQVVEEDLLNSKAVFNPSGSVGDAGPVSIAHMTPAQLVSQLAARAKIFQQSDSNSSQQYRRWNPSNDYDGRGGGGQHFNQNNRYRF